MPRLCYIYTAATVSGSSSVQQKVCDQIVALNKMGIEAYGLFVSSESLALPTPTDAITFIPAKAILSGYFRSIRQRRCNMLAVNNYLRSITAKPDILLMRYPRANYQLWKYTRIWGKKTVMNHVAAEIPEIRLHRNQNNSSLVAGILGNLEFRWWPIFLEKIYGGFIRRNVRCALCNSEDIAQYQQNITWGQYKTEIVSDGVDTQKYPSHIPPLYDGKLSLIFLKGASTDASYNGLDKVFLALKQDPNISLTIVGHQLEYERNLAVEIGVQQQVHFKPAMTREELNVEFNLHHMALGAFGIHRRGLKSNSTLKNREYCARGIPFVFGHNDPDLKCSSQDVPLWLEVPADEAALDMENWKKFYAAFRSKPNAVQDLRKFATEHLDYSVKTKEIMQCLKTHFKEIFA